MGEPSKPSTLPSGRTEPILHRREPHRVSSSILSYESLEAMDLTMACNCDFGKYNVVQRLVS